MINFIKKFGMIIILIAGLGQGLIGCALAAVDLTLPSYTQKTSPPDPGCPGPQCPDQTGGNLPIKDFYDEQQVSMKLQAPKEPCCPGPCCPDMAGGPVSTPSQQTAND